MCVRVCVCACVCVCARVYTHSTHNTHSTHASSVPPPLPLPPTESIVNPIYYSANDTSPEAYAVKANVSNDDNSLVILQLKKPVKGAAPAKIATWQGALLLLQAARSRNGWLVLGWGLLDQGQTACAEIRRCKRHASLSRAPPRPHPCARPSMRIASYCRVRPVTGAAGHVFCGLWRNGESGHREAAAGRHRAGRRLRRAPADRPGHALFPGHGGLRQPRRRRCLGVCQLVVGASCWLRAHHCS